MDNTTGEVGMDNTTGEEGTFGVGTEINQYADYDASDVLNFAHTSLLASFSVLLVLGTIGNTMSFFVMWRGSLKDVSTCFYMSILALVDMGESHSFSLIKLIQDQQMQNMIFFLQI